MCSKKIKAESSKHFRITFRVFSLCYILEVVDKCRKEKTDMDHLASLASAQTKHTQDVSDVLISIKTTHKTPLERELSANFNSTDPFQINTNGILTFMNEFPEFLNIQFPIEYPSISPFYSNVDITLGDASTRISYTQTSSDSNLLSRASSTIRGEYF